MKRRSFLILFTIMLAGTAQANTVKQFVFRIKTKSGNIVGNIYVRAKDVEAAKIKLDKRYPGCTILNLETK